MSRFALGDKVFIWCKELHKYTMQEIKDIERKEEDTEYHYLLDNGEKVPESLVFTGINGLNI
jgi:hypothetical protein